MLPIVPIFYLVSKLSLSSVREEMSQRSALVLFFCGGVVLRRADHSPPSDWLIAVPCAGWRRLSAHGH